ncbi:unnamed protein product [Periconia digitata]|uniref:Uncharacterized protein n=1 Tax=Periconia digitata TaxID=1303443 RepID=A0A9W4U9L7_9PLEO|nr:unnamed protein product [Periconia digitata]
MSRRPTSSTPSCLISRITNPISFLPLPGNAHCSFVPPPNPKPPFENFDTLRYVPAFLCFFAVDTSSSCHEPNGHCKYGVDTSVVLR